MRDTGSRRDFLSVAASGLCMAALSGCGTIRRLTTRRRTYAYAIAVPPVPVALTVHGQTAVNEEVRNTYHKYHGGVDWVRIGYSARNNSADQPATVKLYVSLADGVPADQLDQQGTLVDTITLAPGEDRTVPLEQAPPNETLRAFLAQALSQRDVSAVYWYVRPASADPAAIMTFQSLTVQVQVHGSYV